MIDRSNVRSRRSSGWSGFCLRPQRSYSDESGSRQKQRGSPPTGRDAELPSAYPGVGPGSN